MRKAFIKTKEEMIQYIHSADPYFNWKNGEFLKYYFPVFHRIIPTSISPSGKRKKKKNPKEQVLINQ